jgi:hypothetical protein
MISDAIAATIGMLMPTRTLKCNGEEMLSQLKRHEIRRC